MFSLLKLAPFSILMIFGQALAGIVEAQKPSVDVYENADKKSAIVSTIKKGETLQSLERKGMYWQVKTKDGKMGFVSVLVVKAKSQDGGLDNAIRSAVKAGRTSGQNEATRSRSAVMGVRGLDDQDTSMAGSIRPNMRAVFGMEDLVISSKEIDKLGDDVKNEIAKKSDKEDSSSQE